MRMLDLAAGSTDVRRDNGAGRAGAGLNVRFMLATRCGAAASLPVARRSCGTGPATTEPWIYRELVTLSIGQQCCALAQHCRGHASPNSDSKRRIRPAAGSRAAAANAALAWERSTAGSN